MVRRRRWFDSIVPWETPSNFDSTKYEQPLLTFLESLACPGDDVVVIGGGYGVSTVVAANAVGSSGFVRTYEASASRIKILNETIAMNEVQECCDTIHAIVQTDVEVIGDDGGTETIPASELPTCDVLELDCEGAELEILRELPANYRPRGIVVESHRCFGAPEDAVQDVLEDLGYEVTDREVELADEGIVVLLAKLDSCE